jgi:hypothetical protein
MYILSGGERHYVVEGSTPGFWDWKPHRSSDLRFLIATDNELLPGVDLYEDAPVILTCNVCGERPAEYRITDVSLYDTTTITYSCSRCMSWWRSVPETAIMVAPIKNYGYTCDHCNGQATDVIQHINGGSFWSAEMVCQVHAWRARMWPETWLAGVCNQIPIEDFLMEGMRWPGK